MDSAKRSRSHQWGVRWLWVALGLTIVPLSSSAWAASRDSRAHAARKACLKGNVDRGVDLLTDLFLETKDATYIYNQGRCYEQNHRYDDAVARFREYLMKAPKLSSEEKGETQKHIDACLSYLGKSAPKPAPVAASEQAEAPRAAASPAASPVPAAPPAELPQPVTVTQQPAAIEGRRAGFGLRVAGIATTSVGGAAVLTGLLFNLKVNSMSSDLEAHYTSDTRSTQQGYKTLSQVSYGVGAACLVGGAVLYYLGWKKGQGAQERVVVAPTVSAGEVGAVLGGSF
jgi:hypothetical protein